MERAAQPLHRVRSDDGGAGRPRRRAEPFSRVVDFGEVDVGDRVARTEQDVLAALRAIAAEKSVFSKDTTDFH
jgi:hypothetical protein